ncbi:uncharacterized protein gogo [Periplaneta americana]|uniref:uncharacterized protein gogo n=1 Tax=Periplaneta americana TaxID=6978 RepID=UPI0037E80DC9
MRKKVFELLSPAPHGGRDEQVTSQDELRTMKSAAACWTAAAAILFSTILTGDRVMSCELRLPANHTALAGDLEVRLLDPSPLHGRLQLLRATPAHGYTAVAAVPLPGNATTAAFPCGVVTLGGRYRVVLITPDPDDTQRVACELDVRWPAARLSLTPAHAQTYPEQPVRATLEFAPTKCSAAAGAVIPELWLDLLYCGRSPADCNSTHAQLVFSQQVLGYPRRRELALKCDLFGLAGHYVLTLRSRMPATSTPVPDGEPAHMKVAVSDKFVFNVHARSILPCDALDGGVAVLFQYPACEPRADRVRLFARLRADVASLAPPTSLHYVAEQRVASGAHSLRFSCELFSERYVEYCFVYVTQAVTGAVSDVRMDCVPTLPVRESDSGGWGAWSPWTQCTSSCGGGTRSRYRFCDSPPPRYGAKFCEGASLETEPCGTEAWGCLLAPSASLPADHPEVVAEVGPGCRCGCVVHLGRAKPRRILATSTASCPGRTFWLIQADAGSVVRLIVQHVRLPCGRQWLKVRDGDSLGAPLVAHLSGRMSPSPITSSSNFLLLEFFSDDVPAACLGSFLAHAQQTEAPAHNASLSLDEVAVLAAEGPALPLAHALAAVFVGVVLLVSALLAAQSLFRYRKYQLAVSRDSDLGSAPSRSTLLSEVISLRRLRSGGRATVHTRLRDDDEDDDEEEEEEDESEPEYEVIEGGGSTGRHQEQQQQPAAEPPSEGAPNASLPSTPRVSPAPLRRSTTFEQETPPPPPQNHRSPPEKRRPGSRRKRLNSALSTAPSSVVSSASVTTLNNGSAKERKERRNLERLLAGGASELSLAGGDTTDLELDYYDYNVSNAGAVPGSFLGMDPQYLVWIPPFAPGRWEDEEGDEMLEMRSRTPRSADDEKETRVEKSPTAADDDDIKFADEEDDEDDKLGQDLVIVADNRAQHVS